MASQTNRIARVSDAYDPLFIDAFRELEDFSDRYIGEMVKEGVYPNDYPWPIDVLHNWSRWWEYTFVWLQIKPMLRDGPLTVLDVGPALTFFPFFLLSRGCRVVAIDVDERMAPLGTKALKELSMLSASEKRHFSYVTADATSLPLKTASIDVVTAISVIEHIVDQPKVLKGIFRVLTSEGAFIVTIDVSLDGLPIGDSQPLRPHELDRFIHEIERIFGQHLSFSWTHPMDILHPGNYPKNFTRNATISPRHASLISRFLFLLWHGYGRQMRKFLESRIFISPLILFPLRLIRFLFNPRRLEMWTVMGFAARKRRHLNSSVQ